MTTTALPVSLKNNPRLSQWLDFREMSVVTVRSGKVELGQGIATALAQIAAAELGVSFARIRMVAANTRHSPDEGMTAGSLSIQDSGSALRRVCAQTRTLFLQTAADELGAKPEDLELSDGTMRVRGSSNGRSYWDLAVRVSLECEASAEEDFAAAKFKSDLVGAAVARLDFPDKFTGAPRFIQDFSLPGMLFGRVARPPSVAAQLVSVDWARVKALDGVVATVQDGRFLGVVADSETAALAALKVLKVAAIWSERESLPDMHALDAFLRGSPHETTTYAQQEASAPLPSPARVFSASYSRPFLAHASIGPSCAVARCNAAGFEVWTHSQGIYNLRTDLSKVLSVPVDQIQLQHVEGSGCYGHNGADDVACDAALLARSVPGRAVQVQWSREDELSWAPLGAAMAVDLRAEVDAQGRIARWEHEVWSNGHSSRPGRSAIPVLLAGGHLAGAAEPPVAINMPLAAGGGAERNSIPLYNFAQWRALSHRVLAMPLRTSALRSLGAHCNVFASESFIDEIALALEVDPLEFRLRHLDDERARAVLNKAVEMSGWKARSPATGRGMGLGVSRYKSTGAYCAVVAAVDAGRELRVTDLWIAVDVGQVVNPDGVKNQIEGGAIQTVSWVLKESVQFDHSRVTSDTWESYPILRFSEVPRVAIELIEPPGEKSLGAGEATHGPVAAAIANALAEALSVRVRAMPLSTDAITRALMDAP